MEHTTKHGGTRTGAGRKPLTPAQIREREIQRRQIVIDELLFPALVQVFKTDADIYGDRYLEVQLSKMDIELAYGKDGLAEWMTYFKVQAIGGFFADSSGKKSSHPTRWTINLSQYGVILKFIQSLGHDVKNLPDVWFPPEAMMNRVNAALEKRAARKLKKMNVVWDEMEARA